MQGMTETVADAHAVVGAVDRQAILLTYLNEAMLVSFLRRSS